MIPRNLILRQYGEIKSLDYTKKNHQPGLVIELRKEEIGLDPGISGRIKMVLYPAIAVLPLGPETTLRTEENVRLKFRLLGPKFWPLKSFSMKTGPMMKLLSIYSVRQRPLRPR